MYRNPAMNIVRKGALAYVGAIAMAGDRLTQTIDHLSTRGAQLEQDARKRLRMATETIREEVAENQGQLLAEGKEQLAEARGALQKGRDRLMEVLSIPTQSSVDQLSTEVVRLSIQIDGLRRQTQAVEEPLPGYDQLNAESVINLLPSLSEQKLLAVRNYEQVHNSRITVLRAIDKQIEAKVEA